MPSAKTCVVCEKKIEMASFKNGKVCSENCRSALEKSEEVCAEMNHSAEETIPHDFSYPVVALEPENLSEKTPSSTKVFDMSSLSEVPTDLMDEGIKYSEKIDCEAYVLKDLEETKKLFDIQDSDFDDFEKENDPVNHPSHYTGHPSGIECIDVIEANTFYNLAAAMKYIWRVSWGSKDNDIQDLEKAAWYIRREIDRRNFCEGLGFEE